ncbi:Zinc finger protein [Oopsacas minuta]|uniref:Zinc finger protein n=1 Tax=Oopsacas minuta TaxID=111878 RepID=A0AAV7KJS0_9METZ|nr:Zinc finger protein [Oopsacas minuta]
MTENISLNMSVPFTPSAFPLENEKIVSNSILNGTNTEFKPNTDSYASSSSCNFYTPDGSSNNLDLNAIPTPNTVISDVVTKFELFSPQNDPLFSRNATEFICNLNPPNSSFQIGASNTQTGKIALLPTPNKDIFRSNKISRVSVSPLPVKYRRITPSACAPGELEKEVKDSGSSSTNAYSSRKFCQTIDSNHKNQRPRILDLSNETFHSSQSGLGSPTLRKKLFRPSTKKRVLVFSCNSCSNTYTSKMKCDLHMSRHYDGIKLWECDVCNQTFHSKRNYTLHKHTHFDSKTLRRSVRNIALSNTILSTAGIPNKMRSSAQKAYELKKSFLNKPKVETVVTPKTYVKDNLNFKLDEAFFNRTTSTPVSTTRFKHKLSRRSMRKTVISPVSILTPQSPDLPEIGFSEKTPNKIIKNSNRKVATQFTCDQCPRACSTMRALNIHKHMHKKLTANTSNREATHNIICDQCARVFGSMRALNRHKHTHRGLPIDNKLNRDENRSLNFTRQLRKVSRRPSPCKLCDFGCSLHVLQYSYASSSSCNFYTPDGSSNNLDLNAIPTPNTVISDVVTKFELFSPQNDPLFSRNATEFICNLNPPNSSFQIGASNTQTGKIALLPTPNKDILGSNHISPVPDPPEIGFSDKTPKKRNIYRRVSKRFTCDQCPRFCSSIRALKIHKNEMHKKMTPNTLNRRRITCDLCWRVCSSKRALSRHNHNSHCQRLSISKKSNCD